LIRIDHLLGVYHYNAHIATAECAYLLGFAPS